MKQVIVPLMVLLAMLCSIETTAICKIKGTVTDDRGNPFINASVEVKQGSTILAAALTDLDGKYSVSIIRKGVYDMVFRYQKAVAIVTNVQVPDSEELIIDQALRLPGSPEKDITIHAMRPYHAPLIDARRSGGHSVRTAESIEHAPTVNMSDMATMSTQSTLPETVIGTNGGRPYRCTNRIHS